MVQVDLHLAVASPAQARQDVQVGGFIFIDGVKKVCFGGRPSLSRKAPNRRG